MKKYINKLELKNGIKILKKRTSIVLGSSLLVLGGCRNNVEYVENTTEIVTESTTEHIEPTTEMTTEYIEVTTESTESIEKSKDEIITEFFAEQKEELQQYVDSNDVENIKTKGKDIFTTFVDFIFYDEEIYGIKYDELSEGVKEQLYNDFYNIDTIVSGYDPDYKDSLADKYYKIKDFVSPYYYSSKDKIKEYIGTDNLDKIETIKENAGEVGEDLWKKGKEKIKEKYEDWRDE